MRRRDRLRDSVIRSIENLSRVLLEDREQVSIVPVMGPDEEFDGELPHPCFTLLHSLKGQVLAMAEITNTQRKRVHFKVKNRRGGPARLDGIPEWFTDNSDVLRLEPAADGMSCYVYAVGPITVIDGVDTPANVTMRADADLGSGIRPILGTMAFTVTPGEASVIELEEDDAEEQPDEDLNRGGQDGGATGTTADQGTSGATDATDASQGDSGASGGDVGTVSDPDAGTPA